MAFGKMGEESVGLLKSSSSKHAGGKTYTKYGTVRKDEEKKPSISGLFRYANRADMVIMSIGIICSVIHGLSFPVLALVFGQMTNTFIIQAMHFSNVTNMSTHNISEPTTQNRSVLNIPVAVVGDDTDRIHSNPFDYANNLNLNDITTDLPLSDESSTFGAFFMSEMERMTAVKIITGIDMKHTSSKILSNDGALSPEEFYNYITKCSLFYLYIGCGVLIAAFIQTFCWEISCERQIYRIRKIFYRQILRQEIGLYDLRDGVGKKDLSAKLSDDLEKIREGIGSKFSMVVQYLSTFFSGIIIGFYINWRLTSIILCVVPIFVAVSGVIARISTGTAAREQLKYGLAGIIAEEVLSNIRTIAAFGGEIKESKRYALAIDEGRKLAMKKYYILAVLLSAVFVTLYSIYGLAFWYGSNLIADGISSPGSVFTVLFSVMAGAFSVGNALQFINSVSVAVGAASTIFDIIDSKPSIDPYSSQGKKIRKIKGKIEFKNVSFSYPTRPTESVLNNLSFTIEPGKTVALVGTSEGGKSTIGSLLYRFYDPTEGQVLFDDANIKDLNVHWLRGSIGIVSQEPVLFGVSIAENIRFGQPDCTQQDVIAAAMTANAHSFIIKLPMGYETIVEVNGSQLSSGQKQRIAIARTLVKDPKVLLLDETTSALDTQSEEVVQDALEKARKDRTTIVITHRLSAIKNADVVYVLQKGSVVEYGAYDVLMEKYSPYSNSIKVQIKQKIDELIESDEELTTDIINSTATSTTQNIKSPNLESHNEVDVFTGDVEVKENIEAQTSIEKNVDESKNTNLSSVVETIIEPEEVYTDSFITEDTDGRKVNVTRKVSSHKVKRIIYLDEGGTSKELDKSFIYHPCRVRGSILRQLSQPDDYSQGKNSDEKCVKDFNQTSWFTMSSRRGYQYINGQKKLTDVENVGIIDLLKINCREWPWLVLGFIGSVLTGAIMPIFAIFYGQVFSTFTLRGDALLREAAFWSKMFIVLALASGLAWWTQVIGLTYSAEKLIMRMRIQAFQNVLRQPVFWFDLKNSSPTIIVARLARDAPIVKSAGGLRVGQILSIIITLIAALTLAFTFGWKLAIVLVFGVPIIAGATYKQLQLMRKRRNTECVDKTEKLASETVENIKTVQSLAQELMFVTQYENSLKNPFETVKKQVVSYAIVYAVSQAVVYVMYAAAFLYGAYLVKIGDMSATDVYRVFFALAFCAASVGQSSAYLQDYARAKYEAIQMFRLIRKQSEIDPLSISGSKPEIEGKVHFKDVRFEYPSRPDVPVLQGVGFTVEPGKTLAIVGESGCGKSTIVSLLERFYDPTGGVIEVDNHDIRAMNLSHLRRHIGIVTQEPILFDNWSIKDNIAYGVNDRKVTMDEIIDVAKKANIHNFIESTLAQKYDTLTGDCAGSPLTSGQKQQIAIARALIRNPKILLLDEATSVLDTESETVVQKALDMACKSRTCIIIAHRLSTIQSADSIAVIHNGKIVEQGNHEELKDKKGYYCQLIKCQEKSYF